MVSTCCPGWHWHRPHCAAGTVFESRFPLGPGAPIGVTRLGSPASPRIVPVDAAACRAAGPIEFFGLWRVRFPPVLVRTGRQLPVQALGERGVWVALTGYPRGGAPGP